MNNVFAAERLKFSCHESFVVDSKSVITFKLNYTTNGCIINVLQIHS